MVEISVGHIFSNLVNNPAHRAGHLKKKGNILRAFIPAHRAGYSAEIS